MSVETLLTLPREELEQRITVGGVKARAEYGHSLSLPATLGHECIVAGEEGLHALDKISFLLHPLNLYEQMTINVAGIFLGNTLVLLEEALMNEKIDLNVLCGRINKAAGFSLKPDDIVGEKTEKVLDFGDWNQMRAAANDDKTFAIFFEKDDIMPEILKDFLSRIISHRTGETMWSVIQQKLLPDYKTRAQALLDSPTKKEF